MRSYIPEKEEGEAIIHRLAMVLSNMMRQYAKINCFTPSTVEAFMGDLDIATNHFDREEFIEMFNKACADYIVG